MRLIFELVTLLLAFLATTVGSDRMSLIIENGPGPLEYRSSNSNHPWDGLGSLRNVSPWWTPGEWKRFSPNSRALQFAKIRDQVEKTLGTRELIFFPDEKSLPPIRDEAVPHGTSVLLLKSLAEFQSRLPATVEVGWLNSHEVGFGEFAGQQWVNDFGQVDIGLEDMDQSGPLQELLA